MPTKFLNISTDNTLGGNASSNEIVSSQKAVKEYIDAKDMVVLDYGTSTWQNFIDAYNTNRIVYCKASSGSGYRLAFMAYVNSTSNPTNVEFQYYRSMSSHSESVQGDEVYIYKLTSSNEWTTTTRKTYTKIDTGTGLSKTYSNGVLTLANSATQLSDLSDVTIASLSNGDTLVYNSTSGKWENSSESETPLQIVTFYYSNNNYACDTSISVIMEKLALGWEIRGQFVDQSGYPEIIKGYELCCTYGEGDFVTDTGAVGNTVTFTADLGDSVVILTGLIASGPADTWTWEQIPQEKIKVINLTITETQDGMTATSDTGVQDIHNYVTNGYLVFANASIAGQPTKAMLPLIIDMSNNGVYVVGFKLFMLNEGVLVIGYSDGVNDDIWELDYNAEVYKCVFTNNNGTYSCSMEVADVIDKVVEDHMYIFGVEQDSNNTYLKYYTFVGANGDLSDEETANNYVEFSYTNGTTIEILKGTITANGDTWIKTTTALTCVRYDTASQGLTSTQQSNARTNIGAGTSNFSGSYNDLTNKPTIPAAQVNSDWNSSSGVSEILNKPTLATVATSGSYNDLSNKPTITDEKLALTVASGSTSGKVYDIVLAEDGTQSDASKRNYTPKLSLVYKTSSIPVNNHWDFTIGEKSVAGKPNLILQGTSYASTIKQNTQSSDVTLTLPASTGTLALTSDIPAAQVNSDWNSSSGVSQILNKPTLGTAAACNTGTSSGNVPVLDSSGKLSSSVYTNTDTLSGLTDTAISTPTNGQVLTYNSTTSKWVNSELSEDNVIYCTWNGSVLSESVKDLYEAVNNNKIVICKATNLNDYYVSDGVYCQLTRILYYEETSTGAGDDSGYIEFVGKYSDTNDDHDRVYCIEGSKEPYSSWSFDGWDLFYIDYLQNAITNRHSHSNKTILDKIPSSLGTQGQVLTVGSGSTLSFANVPTELPTTTGNAGKVLTVNSGATGVEWVTPNGGHLYTLTISFDDVEQVYSATCDETITNIIANYTPGDSMSIVLDFGAPMEMLRGPLIFSPDNNTVMVSFNYVAAQNLDSGDEFFKNLIAIHIIGENQGDEDIWSGYEDIIYGTTSSTLPIYNISGLTDGDSFVYDSTNHCLTNKTINAVTGTNDGTNWTSLTVGSDTYAIPSGGGGGGGSLPSQTGHSGEYLTTNGSSASWAPIITIKTFTVS